ncbi:MAG: PLP-dependent aminotransferase family protein, partial [Bacteroidota bacterium]
MLGLTVIKNEETTLSRQIYDQLRSRIMSGVLKPGEKLASTRDQALNLNVSRNVVLEAYDLLLAEGYVVSIPGSGTYVAEGAVFEQLNPKPNYQSFTNFTGLVVESEPNLIDFRSGLPALDLLPRKKLGQYYHQLIMDVPDCFFGYDLPEGTLALREAICRYLIKNRGVQCSPEQMIVTSGAVQGMSLISRLLLTPDQPYVLEYPLHQKIKELFEISGAKLHFVPVDENGLRTQDLPKNINPALIMVTPSHQYPLG